MYLCLVILLRQPSVPQQVAGCTSDPNEMKVYHIRNKVCNTHLTMDEVDIDGTMMRFCRQCARFQPVTEFDSMKRSCRVRLEKHNERQCPAC